MLNTMTSARRRLVIMGFLAIAISVAVVLVIALNGTDSKKNASSPQPSAASSSPDSSITSTIAAGPTTEGTAPSDPINPPFQRSLQAAGIFSCGSPGHWKPYLDRALVIAVGEPPGGSSCAQDVVDLPFGFCSQKSCAQIPPNWDVRLQPGVPPDSLLLLVAPVDAKNARLYCYRNFVADPVKQGLISTPIELACPTSTTGGSTHNSVDIPYVPPPGSVDLPTVAPNASTDLPAG
jgi:hypothetical protein